jgi:hypothetical protein
VLNAHVADLLQIGLDCVRILASQNLAGFLASFTVGAVLAALCWYGCAHYALLWNKQFHATVTHHVLCAMAAVVTFIATITWSGLGFLNGYAQLRVRAWQAQLLVNPVWNDQTFVRAYRDVQKAGVEDFRQYPLSRRKIPADSLSTRELVAARYASEAVRDFRERAPWLGSLLTPSTVDPRARMRADMNAFFRRQRDSSYALDAAVALVARLISEDLIRKTPRLVTVGRSGLVVAFVLVQLIPLGFIGWAATRDIRPHA